MKGVAVGGGVDGAEVGVEKGAGCVAEVALVAAKVVKSLSVVWLVAATADGDSDDTSTGRVVGGFGVLSPDGRLKEIFKINTL